MHKKLSIILILTAMITLASCGSVKNQSYIDEIKKSGADEKQVQELIDYEKTNKSLPDGGYVNVSGKTVEQAAKDSGMTLEEYIKENNLPENLPALVSETEASYTIPVSKKAEMYGMDFEQFKQMLNLPDTITEDTTWGEALGQTTVGAYIGEAGVEDFKKRYVLDDSVTADTLWSEVREKVDEVNRQNRVNAQNATTSPTQEPVKNTDK